MKKVLLLIGIIILIPITASFDTPLDKYNSPSPLEFIRKADFRIALQELLKQEGYYVNHQDDRGKETYGGISRKYNPNWWGWRFIDEQKKKNGEIKRYTRFPELDFWVQDYYLDIWVKEEFYLLRDQQTANYVLDFRINGTIGARLIQKTLIDLGHTQLKLNNRIDSATIHAINLTDKERFLTDLRIRRVKFYKSIVARDSTQNQFLKHWLLRAKNI